MSVIEQLSLIIAQKSGQKILVLSFSIWHYHADGILSPFGASYVCISLTLPRLGLFSFCVFEESHRLTTTTTIPFLISPNQQWVHLNSSKYLYEEGMTWVGNLAPVVSLPWFVKQVIRQVAQEDKSLANCNEPRMTSIQAFSHFVLSWPIFHYRYIIGTAEAGCVRPHQVLPINFTRLSDQLFQTRICKESATCYLAILLRICRLCLTSNLLLMTLMLT